MSRRGPDLQRWGLGLCRCQRYAVPGRLTPIVYIDALHEAGVVRRTQSTDVFVANLLVVGPSIMSVIPRTRFASQGRVAA